jgi:hypothetical protein
MSNDLGALHKVNLRTYWQNEAYDFTPWLAAEENISMLSEALGIDLEVENTEVAAGPYSADILARDTITGDYVVIENQLGKTDHDHLGKAITYAAVLNASAVIWIAAQFTDEHKKSLDWLNDTSTEDSSYFGVVLELWKIDSSKPAVRFNVVSRPAGLARKSTITKASSKPLTDDQKLQYEWWEAFRESILEKRIVTSAQSPHARFWFNVALGRSGFTLSNTASVAKKKIGVRLYISNRINSEAALQELLTDRDEIEREVGESLLWDPNPQARDKTVRITIPADLRNKDKWPEYLGWMVDMTSKFRQAFAPRVKELDLTADTDDELTDE